MEEDKNKKNWVKCSLWGCFAGIICVIIFKYIEIIVSYCNSNQGFVSALLALSSVSVAVVALFISIKTSEKQNKIQIDLQARQIKLDSFQLRYECWNMLSFINVFISVLNNCEKAIQSNDNERLLSILETLNILKKTYLIEDDKSLLKIKFVFKSNRDEIENIVSYVSRINSISSLILVSNRVDNYKEYLFNCIVKVKEYRKLVKIMIIKLEQELDISELHKIDIK